MSSEAPPPEFADRLSEGRTWRDIVAMVGDLPPMPHVAGKALKMVEDPDATASDLTDLLSKDTALAARVMKIANSAMFSRQRQITTLNQAIMMIGFKALKGIIVAAALRQLNRDFGKLEKLVWEGSMACAMCATAISKRLKKPYIEEIFLLGLLHSLGQIVLLFQPETKKLYQAVLKRIQEKGIDYNTAEQEVFGFAHPLIGALVAKKWNFSAEACQVILHYKDPIDDQPNPGSAEEKTAMIQLADCVAHMCEIGSPAGYPDQRAHAISLAPYVGIDKANAEAVLTEIVTATREQFSNEKSVYE